MLKIAVPTDFSDNALNALDFAIELVNHTGGIIQLYHVYSVPSSTGSFISIEQLITEVAEKEMATLLRNARPKLKENVVIDYTLARGSVVPTICSNAESRNYDLIIMGTMGESGLKSKIFGSNASGIMNRTKLPVLAIPSEATFKPLDKIVVAIDDQPISDKSVMELLNTIQNTFKASLNLFHLEIDPAEDKGIHASVVEAFDQAHAETFKSNGNESIQEKIDDYAEASNADLLCMIRRKRGLWHEFLNPSITKKEVKQSSLPLLILHD